jgi:hypothetical protein
MPNPTGRGPVNWYTGAQPGSSNRPAKGSAAPVPSDVSYPWRGSSGPAVSAFAG